MPPTAPERAYTMPCLRLAGAMPRRCALFVVDAAEPFAIVAATDVTMPCHYAYASYY